MSKDRKIILFIEDVYSSIQGICSEIDVDYRKWLCDTCTDVAEAWAYLCRHRVAAVVIDVMLPSVDGVPGRLEGLHLAAGIRGHDEALSGPARAGLAGNVLDANRSVPICLLTGRKLDHIRKTADKLGMTLVKSEEMTNDVDPGQAPGSVVTYLSKNDADAAAIMSLVERLPA